VQNECLSIKSRIEALDGDRQPLVNERCFAAVTRDVADSSAEVIKKLVCRLIHWTKRLHGDYYYYYYYCIIIIIIIIKESCRAQDRPIDGHKCDMPAVNVYKLFKCQLSTYNS